MPRLKGAQMGGQWFNDGSWCPGCGLHAKVTGAHRADCTRGHHGHVMTEPCTDRCEQSTTVVHTVDNPEALHHGPDTRASPNP